MRQFHCVLHCTYYIVSAFSKGFLFFYWDFYKDKDQFFNLPGNENTLAGYTPKQLYVSRRFDNFKEEILHHFHVNKYRKFILGKATEILSSAKMRNLTAGDWDKFHHYGIPKSTPISIEHIMAIIMYCDMDTYSSKFSQSFRKLYAHETIQSVKDRNAKYWWQSKLLKEAVCIYGKRGIDEDNGGESGPFYSGVTCVLPIPEFFIRLHAPTSTSKHIEISIRFTTDDGMIVTINNDLSPMCSFFDCSWISRYPDEEERLFIHGSFGMRIESVRIVKTNTLFKTESRALFLFDFMVSGYNIGGSDEENRKLQIFLIQTNMTIIDDLLKNECVLNPNSIKSLHHEETLVMNELINDGYTQKEAFAAITNSNNDIHPYLSKMFHSYLMQKKEIFIRLKTVYLFKSSFEIISEETKATMPYFFSLIIEHSKMRFYQDSEVQAAKGSISQRENLS